MENYNVTNHGLTEHHTKPVFLDESQAAEYLSLSPQALRLWRKKREQGLEAPVIPFCKLGRLVRYRKEDVDQFLLEQIHAE